MDRLSKENKKDAYLKDSRPNYANKCLITSLSARLVLNSLSIEYITQHNQQHFASRIGDQCGQFMFSRDVRRTQSMTDIRVSSQSTQL